MSVNALVQQVGEVLARAHALFGDPPTSGEQAAVLAGADLADGQAVAHAGQRQMSGLSGRFATRYGLFADHTGLALHSLARNDERLAGELQQAADVDRAGRANSGAVINAAAADTAALAPLANTPAGEKALLSALRARMAEQHTIVESAKERDAQIAAQLRSWTEPAPDDVTGADDDPAKHEEPVRIPPSTAPPDEVKKWWDSLSERQRDQLIAQHPPELGNLNGINAAVRDTVNQAVMTDDINRVEDLARQRGISATDILNSPARYGLSPTDVTRYRNAVQTRDGLTYDRGPDPADPRPVMLWAYDPSAFNGWGSAAIAIGNPDYARNIAVIVPGTSSSVAQGWLSGHPDAINLYDQSLAADPDHHYTSVIAWMGYEAPHGFDDLRVSEPGLARAGGELLAADVNGLWVTHHSLTPEHITVIGHSYGSTTVADAFAHSHMHANEAILIGCPGTDLAGSAADFHLDGGHLYVGSASTDPVSWIGQGSGLTEEWLKEHLMAREVPVPPDAGLGRDPAGAGYGSIRFHAEAPGSGSLSIHDHSHYYVIGSEALRAMTDIAGGHPDHLGTDGLVADGRRQPHVGPFRVPGIPGFLDPEHDRPRDTIRDDHQYFPDEPSR